MQIRMDKENRELKAHGSYKNLAVFATLAVFLSTSVTNSSPATSAAPFPGTGTRKLS